MESRHNFFFFWTLLSMQNSHRDNRGANLRPTGPNVHCKESSLLSHLLWRWLYAKDSTVYWYIRWYVLLICFTASLCLMRPAKAYCPDWNLDTISGVKKHVVKLWVPDCVQHGHTTSPKYRWNIRTQKAEYEPFNSVSKQSCNFDRPDVHCDYLHKSRWF